MPGWGGWGAGAQPRTRNEGLLRMCSEQPETYHQLYLWTQGQGPGAEPPGPNASDFQDLLQLGTQFIPP